MKILPKITEILCTFMQIFWKNIDLLFFFKFLLAPAVMQVLLAPGKTRISLGMYITQYFVHSRQLELNIKAVMTTGSFAPKKCLCACVLTT